MEDDYRQQSETYLMQGTVQTVVVEPTSTVFLSHFFSNIEYKIHLTSRMPQAIPRVSTKAKVREQTCDANGSLYESQRLGKGCMPQTIPPHILCNIPTLFPVLIFTLSCMGRALFQARLRLG